MINLGYACLTKGIENMGFKTLRLSSYNKETIRNIIDSNIKTLDRIIDYNIKNQIKMFRISSDIIPLASHEINTFNWKSEFKEELLNLGEKIKKSNIRISMHPGQYTLLNSLNSDVVRKSIEDLIYHADFLNALNAPSSSKMILHIGGVYNDKKQSMKRFIENYKTLPNIIKERLVIENDDRSYNIEDVLSISKQTGSAVVFDNHHNEINPSKNNLSDRGWIIEAGKTWKNKDGRQKVHYSQQDPNKRLGAHSKTIMINKFLDDYNSIKDLEIDIMLEVKDKNISAIKCNNVIRDVMNKNLEHEWSLYKYMVLEKNHYDYQKVTEMLKEKESKDSIRFYNLIESSYLNEDDLYLNENALNHIYGYFKKDINNNEKQKILSLRDNYKSLKNFLYKLSKKYKKDYLTSSYFFIDQIK